MAYIFVPIKVEMKQSKPQVKTIFVMKTVLLLLSMLALSLSANADQSFTEPDKLQDRVNDSLGKIELELRPSISSAELDRMQASILGEWSSVTYPSDLIQEKGSAKEITTMHLRFYSNGTYSQVCETPNSRIEERGYFEITPDGQYLIFYAAGKPGSASETYAGHVVRIQYLRYGEMVLEQPLRAFNLAECAQRTVIRSVAYMQ